MSRVEGKKCRGSRVNVEGSKMSAFFCYFNKKKQTNKTKQNKTKNTERKKIKKKRRTAPETRTAVLLIVNARAVPLHHQANPKVTGQN